jgi:hypothetical protein
MNRRVNIKRPLETHPSTFIDSSLSPALGLHTPGEPPMRALLRGQHGATVLAALTTYFGPKSDPDRDLTGTCHDFRTQ